MTPSRAIILDMVYDAGQGDNTGYGYDACQGDNTGLANVTVNDAPPWR